MASLNPQDAVVYGLTSVQLCRIFNNWVGPDWGTIPSINNSYVTVLPFEYGGYMPPDDPWVIPYLYPSTSSTGSNTYFTFAPSNEYYYVDSAWFSPFDSISAVSITPVNTTATANLNTATLVSDVILATSQLQFTFIPGSTQTLTLQYAEGTTLSTSVTNGITNTTTTGETTTVTTGAKATGTIPGASAEVNASVSEAWSLQQSQAISYSQSETDTVSTTTTTSVAVNVNTATPTSNGQWVYTNTDGQTFYLIPGNQYVAEIQMDSTTYTTPVPNSFNITGPNMTLPMTIQYYPPNGGKTVSSYPETMNVETALSQANECFYYFAYSDVDPSLFSYQTSPVAQVVYSGLVSSSSVSGTNAVVVILPVATTSDAINTTSETNTTTLSLLLSPTADAVATNLDLHAAALKLKSSYGIYYDNTGSEHQITTRNVDISGEDHATIKVGNLDYTLTNFSNSLISTGSGDNKVILTSRDVNNSINLGSGNNQVSLSGADNNIRMGDGANWINITGGSGKNFVVAGDGPTTLTFNNDSGFTQVSNWDGAEDAILFSPNIDRGRILASFDSTHWSYDVYINNKHVANILTTGGLKFADTTSKISTAIYSAPMPYNLKSNEGFVSGLYVDAFARVSDSNGISYWAQQLDAGTSRKTLIQDFMTSSEYNANHLSNSAFVNGIYQNVLGRQADSSGASYWNAQLDAGTSRVAMVGSFLAGSEFNNLVAVN